MKIVWGNSFEGTSNYMSYEKKRAEKENNVNAINNPLSNVNSLSAKDAEKKLREAEDKLLEEYRRQIMEVENSSDDHKTKEVKISGINEKIKQIEEARAQREQAAITAELEKKKAEEDKRKKTAEKNKPEDETGQDIGLSREDIEGMVKLSVSNESLREMKRTRAMLKSEAKQLEIDISNDFGNGKYGSVSIAHEPSNDFKHRQLKKLGKGVAGLNVSIASEVRKLAETASEMAEKKAEDSSVAGETEAQEEKAEQTEKTVDISV